MTPNLDRTEAVPQRACRRGGHHGAKCAPGETGWIDRQPGAAIGKLLAQLIEPDARLRGRGEVGGFDRGDAIESARGQREVGRGVTLEPGPGAFDADAPAFLVRRAEQQGDSVGGAGGDSGDAIGAGLEDGAFP